MLTGKEINRANMIVIDPRMTRTAAHATEYVRMRPGTDIPVIWGMLHHIFKNGWEDKTFIQQRVYGMDMVRKEVEKWTPAEVERVTGIPGAQLERVAKQFATEKPSTLIWCMGATQKDGWYGECPRHVHPAACHGQCRQRRHRCQHLPWPLQCAGRDRSWPRCDHPAALLRPRCRRLGPLVRVWETDIAWLRGRFDVTKAPDGKETSMMEVPGIPSTRWFDAVSLPKDQVAQRDNVKGLFIMGHGGNTVTRMPEMVKGLEKAELLVVADPHPTTFAHISNRKNGTYLLPICTQFECSGSRTASNRSIQWGEKVVDPIFESANDYWVLHRFAESSVSLIGCSRTSRW